MLNYHPRHLRRWAFFSLIAAGSLLWLMGADEPPQGAGRPALGKLLALLNYLFGALCIKASVVALASWIAARKPWRVAAAQSVYIASPIKSFIIGILTLVVGIVVTLIWGVLINTATVLAVIIIPVILFLATLYFYAQFVGLGGIYQQLGTQMRRQSTPDDALEPTYADTLKGGALIETATLVPLIGWLISAYLALAGLGATVLAWFAWRRQRTLQLRQEAAPPTTPPPAEPAKKPGKKTSGKGA